MSNEITEYRFIGKKPHSLANGKKVNTGDILKLTPTQANSLVNRVELANGPKAKEAAPDPALAKAKEELEAANKKIADLEAAAKAPPKK